jgi:hypothetical protein
MSQPKKWSKVGPKRRRRQRKDWRASRQGFLDGVSNFKREREARMDKDNPDVLAIRYGKW